MRSKRGRRLTLRASLLDAVYNLVPLGAVNSFIAARVLFLRKVLDVELGAVHFL